MLLRTVTYIWICVFLSVEHVSLHSDGQEHCFCQLNGQLDDCCCDVETVEKLNSKIYPRITDLVKRNYFRFYRINLNRPCPFWPDDGSCVLKDCSVSACKEDELPHGIKASVEAEIKSRNAYKKTFNGAGNNDKECESQDITADPLGDIDSTISNEDMLAFEKWRIYDEEGENFCHFDDEDSEDMEYIDLLLNPERYTGYKGHSARRVWDSIYEENCFKPGTPASKGYGPINSQTLNSMCLEKRVFYRAISGLHSSINIHLSAKYFFPGNGLMAPRWGPNLKEFKSRFDHEATSGEGTSRLKNLYFVYLLVLRAITKAAPYWKKEHFFTGNSEEDQLVHKHVQEIVQHSMSCPSTFDESVMFTDPTNAKVLKDEFKSHFRNISRIMDCVGCDKCRLWGTVQVRGVGTALKILFSSQQFDKENFEESNFHLLRAEIASLFNVLGRLSSSINSLQTFKKMEHGHR